MPENLVRASAYARTTVRTDSGLGIKNLSRVGNGVPDMYVAFCFGSKLAILGATNGFAGVKI